MMGDAFENSVSPYVAIYNVPILIRVDNLESLDEQKMDRSKVNDGRKFGFLPIIASIFERE
jgi:hypothetical protein